MIVSDPDVMRGNRYSRNENNRGVDPEKLAAGETAEQILDRIPAFEGIYKSALEFAAGASRDVIYPVTA
jgi:hypothetical protein